VWVFVRSPDGSWSQQGPKLTPDDESGGGWFGFSVALSGDGNTALIGAFYDGSNEEGAVGAAWVFVRSGGSWSQQGAKLVGGGAVRDGEQGHGVALSDDGNIALIGGPDDNLGVGAGWVFVRSAGTWSQQGAKLVGSGASGTSEQGFGVALSGDGSTALIGGPQDNSGLGVCCVGAGKRVAAADLGDGSAGPGTC
jgi:hypothetical protein